MAAEVELRRYLVASHQPESPEKGMDHTIGLWEDLAGELIPLIGQEGFTTLYARSIHLTRSRFPWLATHDMAQQSDSLFSTLRESFEERSLDEVGAAGQHLFITFTDILVLLIGESLTFSILRAAWGDEASETTSEE